MNVSRPHLILMHTRGKPFRNQFLFSRAGNPGRDTGALMVVEQCTGPPILGSGLWCWEPVVFFRDHSTTNK